MTVTELKEKLKNYKSDVCHATITEIDFSGDPEFRLEGASLDGRSSLSGVQLQALGIQPFFRVCVSFSGGPGSSIMGNILLPEKDWNGNIFFAGNGGPAQVPIVLFELGGLYDPNVVLHCNLGTADIDVGLRASSATIDHGWRATHLMTLIGKEIVAMVYGRPADYTYFLGMSTGGQQGISAATNCPDDFDGIIAMAPGISRSLLHTSFIWASSHLVREDDSSKVTKEDLEKIHEIVLDYHSRRGYGAPGDQFVSVIFTEEEKEEILAEIKACGRFTDEQMEALRAFYLGPVNPETGERIFCGFPFGCEINQFGMMGHIEPGFRGGQIWLGGWMLDMPNQEFLGGGFRKFDFAKDINTPRMKRISTDMDADSGDLSAFKARGGKLIVVTGLADEFIPPENIVNWYERVIAKQGGLEETTDFCRLFMLPGIGHSHYPNGMDWFTDEQDVNDRITFLSQFVATKAYTLLPTIIRWVRDGVAPDSLTAIGLHAPETAAAGADLSARIARKRPVYPYPYAAEYVSGDPNLPESFRKGEWKR